MSCLRTRPSKAQLRSFDTEANTVTTLKSELILQCCVLYKLYLQVIVTSWLFPSGIFSLERLQQLSSLIGKEQLVIDLSCRRQKNSWFVAINKWQTVTSLEITKGEDKIKGAYYIMLVT